MREETNVKLKRATRAQSWRPRRAQRSIFEALELRQLYAVNGIADNFGQPLLFVDNPLGSSYDADSQALTINASSNSYFTLGANPGDPPIENDLPHQALMQVNLTVQSDGTLYPTQPSNAFQLVEDTNDNGVIDSTDPVLLTGTAMPSTFAFDDSGTVEAEFVPTGGSSQADVLREPVRTGQRRRRRVGQCHWPGYVWV